MAVKPTFALWLRWYREIVEGGMSLEEFAVSFDCDQDTLRSIERGEPAPNDKLGRTLAPIVGVLPREQGAFVDFTMGRRVPFGWWLRWSRQAIDETADKFAEMIPSTTP